MQIVFKTLLIIHITSGAIGLFTGTINLFRNKGNKNHRIVGKVFTIGMLTAGFSSLFLSIIHPNIFLFIIGVFTIYLVGTGRRFIYLKLLGSNQHPKIIDWILTIGMMVTGLFFIILGIYNLLVKNNFGIVLLVFGFISLRFVIIDFINYNGKFKEKNYWLIVHLQRMIGAYIGSATAFLVVNSEYSPITIPSFIYWLLPTIILTPLIILWTKKYKITLPD